MNILAIETSCDETAAAIMHDDKLLANVVVSQIDIFKAYGGVIPEIAARSHLEAILPVIDQAFARADLKTADSQNDWAKIDAIAVTHTPGLLGSLLIGTLTARTLAILHNKPLYAVHHLKSHIYSNWLECEASTPKFPLLALVISGGHTQIIRMTSHTNFDIIGTTLDDAVGECFDKIAKILGLPYPGGPSIATAALGMGPTDLINDLNTFGLFFETLCVRDLRVFADALDGKVFHYRDKDQLECDAVVHLRNGSYGLVEIKLGGDSLIEEGAKTLSTLSRKIDTSKMKEPSFMMVLTAVGNYAFRRDDGVYVVPIGCLKD